MTLTEKIKSEPYLKISNCIDINDLKWALVRIDDLRKDHPNSKVLRDMYLKFEHKRMKLTGQI